MACSDCKKTFTVTTLKKYGGICGRCNTAKKYRCCTVCKKKFTKVTLNKYGGMCGRCSKVSSAMLPVITDRNCVGCSRTFKIVTLDRYGGICGRCNTAKILADRDELNGSCSGCHKLYTKATLKKYGGVCGRCNNASPPIRGGKATIPKSLRRQVWIKYNGESMSGTCYSCDRVLYSDNFQAGHITAEYVGGEATLENLQPICKPCNTSSGTRNLDDFKNMMARCVNLALPAPYS